MDRLSPIPTPHSHLWREFRIRVLPPLLFAAIAAVVVFMWKDNVAAPTLTGEVEKVHANISSPKPGRVAQLNVTRLQRVKAGDAIARVIVTDPQILQSSLAVIEAEIKLLKVNLHPVLGQQRFALNYDHLQLDWMDQRVQLATARVRFELADAELRRDEQLFKDKIISEQVLDAARTARNSLETEIKERGTLADELEQKLKNLKLGENVASYPGESDPEEVLRASIKVQEEKLRLTEAELSPITLTVPMDATVTAILHHSGEAVTAGEPIVTLTALSSDRIVGYLRQPFSFEPKVGMKVQVRARSHERTVSDAEIVEVGSNLEPINSSLSPTVTSLHYHDVGLPILVSVPHSQKLLPGEIVDLRIIGARELANPVLRSSDGRQ